ncbi:hypothetical protein D0Z00_003342 [Geotrichum galactomycetum]|uniref:Uncharacterized protein n=1 Tax=Geotrichum galactomycetum TaxID=27317 RepID=A0ACB6V1I8_9ASCO|nr:hypothetical protein D0Z00_003342 [Geotrichum candidum]
MPKSDAENQEKVSEQEKEKDYYALIRSSVVLIWMFTNFVIIAVVLNTAGLSVIDGSSTETDTSAATTSALTNMLSRRNIESLLKSAPIADKEGNRYTPQVWKGPPSGVKLMDLIEKATDKESFQVAKAILLRYLKHYPKQVHSIHFQALLRASATTGDLFHALAWLQTPEMKSWVNPETSKEALRLYAIRAATLKRKQDFQGLNKLFQKLGKTVSSLKTDLDANLIVIYGLAPLEAENAAAFKKLAEPYLAQIKALAPEVELLAADADLTKLPSINYHYVNFVLGRLGLSNIQTAELKSGLDMTKIDQEIGGLETLLAKENLPVFMEQYVKKASQGIVAETERLRAATLEPAAEAEPEAEK